MVKNDILENEVIELGAASTQTKGGNIAGSYDGDPVLRYNGAGNGIESQD